LRFSLRSLDWAPRQKRKRAKQIEAAIATAEQRLQRSPTEDEIAAQLEIPLEEYHQWLVEICGLNVASLESVGSQMGHDMLRLASGENGDLPSTILERSELERLLAQGIDAIPEMERVVLSLYYQEELTLREIAQVVHLHESRISQLKSQAILRLRGHLAQQWPMSKGMVTA
jgi:RNA polymerase sigma factor for flagellar operon FliA